MILILTLCEKYLAIFQVYSLLTAQLNQCNTCSSQNAWKRVFTVVYHML